MGRIDEMVGGEERLKYFSIRMIKKNSAAPTDRHFSCDID